MFIGEPPRTPYDVNFRLFGFPVRIHPFFWLVVLILGAQGSTAASLVIWIVAVLISILCHELGHAAMMRAYGFHPWITLYGFGGLTAYDQGRQYGSRGAGTLGQVLIAAAGPMAGFLLTALLIASFRVAGYPVVVLREFGWVPIVALQNDHIARLLFDIFFICIIWGVVNLLPIYPLDGGQIAREILVKFFGGEGIRQSLLLSMFAAGMVAAYGFMHLRSWFVPLMFGYLAYTNFVMLQSYTHRRF